MDNDAAWAESTEDVDRVNREFYQQFNYPWAPQTLQKYEKSAFWYKFLNQDIGSFDHSRLKQGCRIWVAGCGTNQAVLTAMKFRDSQILGTDISVTSLERAQSIASQVGLSNLNLEVRSLQVGKIEQQFDYIICTGVIHHTFDPETALQNLRMHLAPDGVLELMVYNHYHRIQTVAFQKAIRLLNSNDKPDISSEYPLMEELLTQFPMQNSMQDFLSHQRSVPPAAKADSLLQPVEHVYTVETLRLMADRCGLTLLQPCISQFDRLTGSIDWNLQGLPPKALNRYLNLPDFVRWQISNFLMLERSPTLWFYLQRKDCTYQRLSQRDLASEFLRRPFKKVTTSYGQYILGDCGNKYQLSNYTLSCPTPSKPKSQLSEAVFAKLDGSTPMNKILDSLCDPTDFLTINALRTALATSAFPYCVAND